MLVLDTDEIEAITGKKRGYAQVRALQSMGIDCIVRPDGRPLVGRAYFEQVTGAKIDEINEPFKLRLIKA